jgi:hypothetical protein
MFADGAVSAVVAAVGSTVFRSTRDLDAGEALHDGLIEKIAAAR